MALLRPLNSLLFNQNHHVATGINDSLTPPTKHYGLLPSILNYLFIYYLFCYEYIYLIMIIGKLLCK